MKKFKKLLKKLKSNAGSSIVMVVVSVAFIGIIVGALLAAAVQSYRLKLQELNDRDNFYYVEQALNEIYAGVGSQTVEDLQDAYVYTVENMVEYDLIKGRYVTKTQDEAQEMFSKEFYRQLQNNPFFKVSLDDLAVKLTSYITNDSVKLDASRIQVVDYEDENNNKVGKIIKNLKLSRTQEYNRSSANGVFTQSITTDIVIGNPDFAVLFDSMNDTDPNIFKYALVADMGVEVDQPTVPLTIAGNVYAASDYYNKQYNESTWDEDVSDDSKKLTTSDTYEIEQEDGLRKYGKSKEHRPSPIVGLGLFMDADGFPLAFDIYPGNQNEQTTLKPLEQKVIRDFDCSKFVFCSDSGLGSKTNRQFNDIGNRSYVITQSLKKLRAEDRETALNPQQYRKLGSDRFIDLRNLDMSDPEVFNTVYYKEIPVVNGAMEETVIVTFSPKYRDYQRKIREGQIERAKKMITADGKIRKNRKNPNDPARFIEEIHVTGSSEVADNVIATLNEEAIANEEMYDGFYAVITDIDDDPSQIIAINKRRWQIEECFRIMKTEFRSRPVYVSTEKAIKAHFLTCFIALLVYRILEYQLTQIVNTLSEMKLTNIGEMGYIPSYTRTELTDALHENAGFRTDTQIVKKSKLRTVIRSTKDKK